MPPDPTPAPAEEIDALLARPLEEFVAARDARVKELRGEGRRPEATALKAVRKPLRLAWTVGEVARRDPDAAARAADVAADLDAAQASGTGVRPLMKAFRDEVAALAEAAGGLGDTVDTLEVGLALREVLADLDARDAWVAGRLLALPGDEVGPTSPVRTRAASGATSRARGGAARGGAGRAARGRRSAATARGDAAGRDAGATDRDEQAAAEARVARATEARDVAVGARDAADEELGEVRAALEGLEAERAALDERIAVARGAVDAAVAAHESASSAAGTAEADLASAEAALADLPEP